MSKGTILDAIEDQVHYDGPHSRDTVIDAAEGIAYLMRYLNNATHPSTAKRTLEWVSTTYDILGSVKGAVYGLDQLLDQLSAAASTAAEDTSVYDTESPVEDRHAEGARGRTQPRIPPGK